jgi:transcriptional regulator with GAF, ATPase, and Fis domain
MTLQVWLYSFCTSGTPCTESVISQLAKANIVVNDFAPDNLIGPGIVVFTKVTPEIYDFIHAFSRNGTRVLGIKVDSMKLTDNDAWNILHAGASDVLFWQEYSDPGIVIEARLRRWHAVDTIVDSSLVSSTLIGKSRTWRTVLRKVVEVARFSDAPVLLVGETGTGKELTARLIHSLDLKRKERELVILDCTTIVPELSGSELYGHEKGAFTGAVAGRDGAFAQADGGTLFLDEVGELPLELQVQLLRVLQEHTYKRVGSNTWHKSDFRLLCATNRDLLVELNEGKFRRDLYYRLASWTINLPALRDRVVDIIPLVNHFIGEAHVSSEPPELDERVQAYFLTRTYPGNVRDLKNLVFRMVARHVGPGPITIGDIPSDERPDMFCQEYWCNNTVEQAIRRALLSGLTLKEIGRTVEETAIRVTVDDENGNLQSAANKLGVTDRTLQKWRAKTRQQNSVTRANGT